VDLKGEFPKRTAFSLASQLVFFRGIRGEETIALNEEQQLLDFYQGIWSQYEAGTLSAKDVVSEYLKLPQWEQDLNQIPALNNQVTKAVTEILTNGMEAALQAI